MTTTQETYADVEGRTQHRVTGPAGVFLITRGPFSPYWEVWRSDSVTTLYRSSNLTHALERAHRIAARV